MHIPDGFIDLKTAVATGVLSTGGLAVSIFNVRKIFKAKVIAMMGVMAALIFALQMINFTIPGGTSGHLLGGALVAIILGPFAGSIVLTVVLIVQAFIFMDGGIVALGSNVFNMAICGVLCAYLVYYLFKKISSKRWLFYTSVAAASWLSVMVASFLTAIELGVSGTYDIVLTVRAMFLVYTVIGIGEAVITTAIIAFIDRIRPDIIITREF